VEWLTSLTLDCCLFAPLDHAWVPASPAVSKSDLVDIDKVIQQCPLEVTKFFSIVRRVAFESDEITCTNAT